MKRIHIYFHIFVLFFVVHSYDLCSVFDSKHLFDFHEEDLNDRKYVELKQKEFLKRYQQLKKQLLELFKARRDNPQLKEEDLCEKPQLLIQSEQEKKDVERYFLYGNQSKPFVLVTIKSYEPGALQSKFLETIAIVLGWFGGGGAAVTAAEIAAIEAAKIAAAKIAAGAAGTFVVGSVIKSGIDKLSEKNNNSGGSGGGGNDGGSGDNGKGNKDKSSQEERTQGLKRAQALRENVNKLDVIKSLEKTDSVQAHKATEELRISLARTDVQEKNKKLIECNFSDLNANPNLRRTLTDVGLVQDTNPGYTITNNPPQAITNPTKIAAPKIVTSTEGKTPAINTQQEATLQTSTEVSSESIAAQTPIAVKSSSESKTVAAQSFMPTNIPAQEQVSIRPSSVNTLTNFSVLHPDIAMHAFIPQRTVAKLQEATKLAFDNDKAAIDQDDEIVPDNILLKKKHQVDSVIKQHLKDNVALGSPVPLPPDKDPEDDWFEKLKKNYEKKAYTKQFGSLYKDPKTNQWWSKDNGFNHGGEHYKVFEETAKGLEWIKDVDLLGNIMKKHKGQTGRFIPYKDIVFVP